MRKCLDLKGLVQENKHKEVHFPGLAEIRLDFATFFFSFSPGKMMQNCIFTSRSVRRLDKAFTAILADPDLLSEEETLWKLKSEVKGQEATLRSSQINPGSLLLHLCR